MTTDNTHSISIRGSEGVTVSGTTKVVIQNGVADFSDLIVTAEPGTTVGITVESDIEVTSTTENQVDVIIELRECEPGEATVGNICQKCEEGYYSLDPDDVECNACPDEAMCYGGIEIVPRAGYWRSSKFSPKLWKCPNKAACDGGLETESLERSYQGRCSSGYKGNMCQSCETDHSRTAPDECGECPDPGENAARLLGILMIGILVIVVVVKTTISSAYKEKEMHSVYIKILVNHIQLIMLTASFDLEWPSFVSDYFAVTETVGSVSEQFFSLDCYIDSSDPNQAFFDKIVLMALVPVIMGLVVLAVWVLICFFKKNWSYLKAELIATLVIILFFIHPTLIKAMFSVMSC